jgi:hypothetical protein
MENTYSVIVKVSLSVTVYVWLPKEKVVASGQ